MKHLKVLTLIFIFGIFSIVFTQEKTEARKETAETPTEMCKDEELGRPIDISKNNPHGFIFQYWTTSRNRPQITNKPADVTKITLSATEIFLKNQNSQLKTTKTIDVLSEAIDPENDVLTYNYTVSGGRIIGTGEKVVWDLSDVKPGEYAITAAVDDGCGFCGRTVTKKVVVKECSDCLPAKP